jgi:DNA-binding NtrC family response regulator
MQPKVLIVDDEPAFCLSMSRYLSRSGFSVRDAGSLHAARTTLATDEFNGVLLDLNLPDGDGLDWLDEIRRRDERLPVLVITGKGDIPVAVEAMRRGADHFLTKPVDPSEVATYVRRFVGADPRVSRAAVPGEVFFGTSAATRKLCDLANLAVSSDSVVLITGETGAGKGVLARWIHEHSRRRSKAFVEINCSALRGELLANELFGHARGAYTSAADAKPGLLDTADGGTLFLDEIGDMELGIQAQFLKTIEEKRYRRLGEVATRRSDFRLICATNHVLEDDVAAGRFRADLWYRINVLSIRVPSLRERRTDIRGFARHLLASTQLDDEALALLEIWDWPGNVRELRNVLERAVLHARGGRIDAGHIEQALDRPSAPQNEITAAIDRAGGDKEMAARELGISRATLYRRLRGREVTRFRG